MKKIVAIVSVIVFLFANSAYAFSCVYREVEEYPIILNGYVKRSFGIPTINIFIPGFQKLHLSNVEILKGEELIKKLEINPNRIYSRQQNTASHRRYIFYLDLDEENNRLFTSFCNRRTEIEITEEDRQNKDTEQRLFQYND